MAFKDVARESIREHRGQSSDAAIRGALSGQGFSSEMLDEAFAEAGPRPAHEPPPASPRSARRPWLRLLFAAPVVLAFGLYGLHALACAAGDPARIASLAAELETLSSDYRAGAPMTRF
ncbi:MAG: hypothetical protein KGJ84_16705 [Elusimicrobia bacterium]|nr:hypothetical protein [Elusimicrobiota bacterium]